MRQILQNLSSGITELAQIPKPDVMPGKVLIATRRTLISAGTERMLVEFGRGSLISKAKQQPDRVKQVLEKMRTDGVLATLDAVRGKLDQPLPLGYCNVGVVSEVGSGITEFKPGDRVASNGPHADFVSVGPRLCARIPDGVSDEDASFTVLGAIALQGIRLANPTLGECVAVTGLGLIGLIAVQLLRAQGCRVLGIDPDPTRVALAQKLGAETVCLSQGEDPLAAAEAFSRGRGIDAVLITASTQSNEPVHQAALMSRKRGRIVLVGVAGLELSRADFYEKELTFQVSCSYGPGRYDAEYEEQGKDYPVGFVRWTQQRNFEAVLDMLDSGALDVAPLVSHRFSIDDASKAYDLLVEESAYMGIVLEYPDQPDDSSRVVSLRANEASPQAAPARSNGDPVVSFIGAGNYAGRVLIPAFKAAGARFGTIISSGGRTSAHFGRKYDFARAATQPADALDAQTDAVVVATRHDSHSGLVVDALSAGKHVFVEKPLALTKAELSEIETAHAAAAARGERPILAVGFNRRFSPLTEKMRSLLATHKGPKALVATMNAGQIPASHWTQSMETGGGRIIGEACHFVDLLRSLVGCPIVGVSVNAIPRTDDVPPDTVSFTLRFEDGSIGTIHYFANGHNAFAKERIEAFAGGRILVLDNFRKLTGYGWKGFSTMRLWRQDKGQTATAKAFLESIRTGQPAVPFAELMEISRVTIEVAEAALSEGRPSA
ncbi:MAG: bi-domain-containing oxidoreductase [Alphaproteobacteria bacterium]|nr:bi-domain-containing oxidoreductase [Alphaproteobacteria bacterium]